MFIFDILVYAFFAVLMSSMAKRSCVYQFNRKHWDDYLKFYIAIYVVICALRWDVGVDSISYAQLFALGMGREALRGEVLFHFFTETTSSLGLHFTLGLGLCAFLQIFPIVKALKEYKYILITLPLVLFAGRYFLDMNNAVRQMMVTGMFVYASRYIVDKKPWHYAAFILLGVTLHRSAYMLVPFYFMPNRLKLSGHRVLMLGCLTFCFVSGLTPAFQNCVQYVERLTQFLGYEDHTNIATSLLSQGKTAEALAFGPIMLSFLLTAYFLIWFGPQLKARYEATIPYFNLWYNFSCLFSCCYFLLCNISHIFIRPVQYFELFEMLMVALLLHELWTRKNRYHQISFFLLLTVLCTTTIWNVAKVAERERESVTYKVFFMHPTEVKRFTER